MYEVIVLRADVLGYGEFIDTSSKAVMFIGVFSIEIKQLSRFTGPGIDKEFDTDLLSVHKPKCREISINYDLTNKHKYIGLLLC